MKNITYAQAINDGLSQAMRLSDDVFVFGQGVDGRSGVFGTTTGLVDEFSSRRVFDTPVAESAMTGVALGASLAGMRPVLVHQRLDFMLYSIDQIVNWAALWRYKSGGKSGVPFTVRAVVGKGWGQGPQHSKSLQAWFAHVPGLKVAMPSTPHDAKGLLMSSIFGEDPTIIIEGRPLFSMSAPVPEEAYRVPFGKAILRRNGSDVTLAALGYMVPMAMRAAERLVSDGISVEVIDPRTVAPLDIDGILTSVAKTGRLVVADPAWRSFGVSAEIGAQIGESAFEYLKAPIKRVALPDAHAPTSVALESIFYPDEEQIIDTVKTILGEVPTPAR
jgi:pyruvate/2-oxoglutarate/acetoin dehydrogenase E1 component